MSTLALEIEVNGLRIAVAGAETLSLLTAHVGAGVGPERRSLQADKDPFHLSAMGLTVLADGERVKNLTWIDEMPLKLGDSVTFRVVSVQNPDPPLAEVSTPSSEELAAAAKQERAASTARSTRTRNKRRAG